MQVIRSNIPDKWLKASVMGSIWAANEILLGSFLHNLRVPLSGTIMAFLSVALMVSFSEMWKEKGLLWRAGLIAALMKSISPSAIILGPMIGIAMEGLFLSFGIFLSGRNILGYMLGGALAVTSVLLQKLGRLLLSYGFDFLEILNNMFIYASEHLRFSTDNGPLLLFTLFGIFALIGVLGSILGFYGGKTARKYQQIDLPERNPGSTAHLFGKSVKRSYSLTLLVLHIAIIITGMYLISSSPLFIVLPYLFVYFIFSIIYYKAAVRRLKNPTFWIWFVGITFLASYFLGDWKMQEGFNISGLKEGLLMNLRAGLVLIGFAAISTELKNPVVKVILYNRGAENLYQGMELAFGILPHVLESFPNSRELIRRPLRNMAGMVGNADRFLLKVEEDNSLNSRVLIITGNMQEGKTTLLKEIIGDLNSRGLKPGGFYTDVIIENQKRTGYCIVQLKDGKSYPLCSIEPGPESNTRYGKFYFNESTLNKGNQTLKGAIQEKAPIIIIDEVGPLEMSDGGWSQGIEAICEGTGIPMIWTVRKSLAMKAARKWRVGDIHIVDIGEERAREEALQAVDSILNNYPE